MRSFFYYGLLVCESEDLDVDGKVIFEWTLANGVGKCRLVAYGSG
jgi:hypothetical protein